MHEIPKRIVPKTKNRVFNAPVGAGILRVLHSYPAYSNNLVTSRQGSFGDQSKPWGHTSMTSKCSNLMTGDQELLVVNGLSGREIPNLKSEWVSIKDSLEQVFLF